jgi:hypothetical protein
MAFPGLGVLAQAVLPAISGGHKGIAIGEAETYRRRQEEKEAEREARLQALRETLLQNEEKRAAEMHPLQMQTERAQALKALPTFAEPPETLGDGLTSRDRLEMEEIESRIRENNAQADYYGRRPSSGGAGGRAVRPEWERKLSAIADATRGDLGAMHRAINEDPELFQLRASGQIRDYHVGAASSKARKTYRTDEPTEGEPAGDQTGLPARFQMFSSESPTRWVMRLKRMGVPPQQIEQYAQRLGIDLDAPAEE